VRIPKAFVELVFCDGDKEKGVSWSDYLTAEILEVGSGILSIYFSRISGIVGDAEEKCRWVIATFDEAIEDNDGMEIRGLAVPFDLNRFF